MFVLALSPTFALSAEYCVKPSTPPATETIHQNVVLDDPCLVFNDYIADPERYFKSNTTFKFLPGIHDVNQTLTVKNRDNIKLVRALVTINRSDISIMSSNKSVHIVFQNHSNIRIEGMSFYLCALEARIGLRFINGTNLTLYNILLNQPCDGTFVLTAEITFHVNVNLSYISTSSSPTAHMHQTPIFLLGNVLNIHVDHFEPAYDPITKELYYVNLQISNDYQYPSFQLAEYFIDIEYSYFCNALYFELGSSTDINITITITNFKFHACRNSLSDKESGILFSFGDCRHQNTNYSIVIENSTISGTPNGIGVYYLPGSSSMLVKNCNITDNAAHNNSVIDFQGVHATAAVAIISCQQEPFGYISPHYRFENVFFERNMYLTPLSSIAIFPALSITGSSVNFLNCHFHSNRGTALYIQSSNISFEGNITFFNNTGYDGGAIYISGLSFLTASQHSDYTSIMFKDNYAEHTGGAILVATSNSLGVTKCFLKDCALNLFFTNNTARLGGNDVYGGQLDAIPACDNPRSCKNIRPDMFCLQSGNETNSCISILDTVSQFSNASFSSVASDPSRVCLCNESGFSDCLAILSGGIAVYPGEAFTLSVVAVGQHFGTAFGAVCVQLLSLNEDVREISSIIPEKCQYVQQHSCNQINYTIYSNNKDKILVLTSFETEVTEYGDNSTVNEAISAYYFSRYNLSVPLFLLATPIFINISLKACPTGFSLTSTPPFHCICIQELAALTHHGVSCDINTQTVQRRGTVWIGASGNTSDGNGVIVTEYCPYYYCSEKNVNVSLSEQINNALSHYTSDATQYENISFHSEPDPQCNFNRSGRLCGRCPVGQSVALGTSQCLKCSNNYLSLLVPFAVSGVVLVLFIKALNLTPAQGLINGLIFYANIVKANEYIFFPQKQTNFLTVFISWLNLDLGIETCFLDGLDGYWKTWLQFVFPLYVWVIAFAMIMSARYSIRVARLLGNNSVPVLVTLFYLSYAKLFRTVLTTIHYTVLEYPSGHHKVVWSYDGTIEYLSSKHAVLFAAALLVLLFLWLPYTCVLFFGQWFNRCSNRKISMLMFKMKPLFDAHYGPFKDKHRYWFGVLLGARAAILLTSSVVPLSSSSVNSMAVIVVVGLLFTHLCTVGRVYRKFYVSLIEAAFFLNLTILAATVLYTDNDSNQLTLSYIMVGAAFAKFVVIVAIHLFLSVKTLCYRALGLEDDRLLINQHEDEDLDFDRKLTPAVRNN